MQDLTNKTNEELIDLIEYTDLKQEAGAQLMQQSPTNDDLRYIIEYTDLKQEAWAQLMQQSPTNDDLRYIIRYTDLKQEAGAQLMRQLGIDTPVDEQALIKEIAQNVLARPGSLQMNNWHCGTSHCLAGWATVLNPVAAQIEAQTDTDTAGCAVLPSFAHLFFSDNDTVLAKLKEVAAN